MMPRTVFFLILWTIVLMPISALAVQPAVPLSSEKPFRLTVDPVLSTDFGGLNRAEVSVDFAQALGAGFEWGVALHGGAASKQLFLDNQVAGILGLDLMGRYFGSITDVFYIGFQLDLLYTHNFSQLSKAGAAGARFSIPFTTYFEDAVALYLMPGIQFEGMIVNTNAMPASTFGQSLGASVALGLVLYTRGPGLFLSARPTWTDVRAPANLSADFALGLVFDF